MKHITGFFVAMLFVAGPLIMVAIPYLTVEWLWGENKNSRIH